MINKCLNVEKALAAYAIVLIHCLFPSYLGIIMDCIARFAIPLFFLISGYFCYYDESLNSHKKFLYKIKKIGKLIILSQLLALVLQISLNLNNLKSWFLATFNFKMIVILVIFNESPLLNTTWFLFALLYCYIIIAIINKYSLFKIAYILTALTLLLQLILGELLSCLGIFLPLYMVRNFLLMGFPFLMIGYLIHKNESKIIFMLTNKQIKMLILISLFTVVIERYFTSKNDLYVSSIFTACLLCIYAIKNKDSVFVPMIEIIGRKYSLGIYLIHPMLLLIINKLEYNFRIDNIIYLFIKPIFLCVLSTFLVILFIKLKIKIISNIKLSKKNIESTI